MKLFKVLKDYFKDVSLQQLSSPFTGNVIPVPLLRDVNLSRNVIGHSIGVIPESEEIRAPCDCVVKYISEKNNAVMLQHGKIEIILNLGISHQKYDKSFFELKIKQGDTIKEGQIIFRMLLNKILAVDSDFVCVFTVKHSKELKYINLTTERYLEFSNSICDINVY